jgi:YVTN family beta-propeller protein
VYAATYVSSQAVFFAFAVALLTILIILLSVHEANAQHPQPPPPSLPEIKPAGNTAGIANSAHCDQPGWPSCYDVGFANAKANPGTPCPLGHSTIDIDVLDPLVSVIDGSTNTVVKIIEVGQSPQVVAFDLDNGNMYVANFASHTVSVIDGSTNTVIKTIDVGSISNSFGVELILTKVSFNQLPG